MGQRDVGVVSGDGFDGFPPQLRAFQHVHFVNRAEAFLPAARCFKGNAGDAAHFAFAVAQGVVTLAFACGIGFDAARLAEVDATGEFAHDEDIQPLHAFGFQRGAVNERVHDLRRAQVGEQSQIGADGKQAGFRTLRARQAVPFWPADAGEQHGIGGAGFGAGRFGIGFARGIHRATAEVGVIKCDRQPGFAL